jgi:hypothetical protein
LFDRIGHLKSCRFDQRKDETIDEKYLKVFKTVFLPLSRSASQITLDSIDQLTRYSEDTDRKEEDRLAILEYELRTSR